MKGPSDRQDPAHLESVIPILQGLLADRSPLVVGSAVAVFEEVCPDHIELLHAHYRHICASLVDSDEWGQLAIIRTMARYARLNFLKPTTSDDIDQDLQRFLSAAEKSLQSSNPAVSMAAVRVVLGLAPSSSSIKAVFPLLRLLHASEEIQQLALYDVAVLAQSKPVRTSGSNAQHSRTALTDLNGSLPSTARGSSTNMFLTSTSKRQMRQQSKDSSWSFSLI